MTGIIRLELDVSGPAGRLEAVAEHGAAPSFVGIVCHPHPLHGGTMDNKVVTTLVRTVRDQGGVGVRFNFRGVGGSEGAWDEGRGEIDDLLAVVRRAREMFPGLPWWLAGFSFGSYVALRGAVRLHEAGEGPRHLLLVAPPVHHYDFEVEDTGCPVTLIQGEQDEVVPAEEVLRWAGATPLRPTIVCFPDSGHFFHGRLNALRDAALATLPR